MRQHGPTEKAVQHAVKQLLALHRIAVYDTSQPQRALITPGLSDLIALAPGRGALFIECKAPGGRQSPAQRQFQVHCEAAGAPYILGGLDEVLAFLSRL